MSDTAARLRGIKQTEDVGVSVDGTRQRKVFSSKLGLVTAISIDNGKVLDAAILSKPCKDCTSMKKVASSDPVRYDTWTLSHYCNLNYTGSSPGIEAAGATKIFILPKEKHGLYQTSFYGDGNSKAYPAAKDIYGPSKLIIEKFECVGHYQKRIDSRLRDLKKTTQKEWEDVGKDREGLEGIEKDWEDLPSNVENLEAMKPVFMALMSVSKG